MLKENATLFRRIVLAVDLVLAALAFLLAYRVTQEFRYLFPLSNYLGLLPVFLVLQGALMYFCGVYVSIRTESLLKVIGRVLQATAIGFFAFTSFNYLIKAHYVSRTFVFCIFLFAAVLICVAKVLTVALIRFYRRRGFNYRSILIIGTGRRAQAFVEMLNQHSEWGFRVVGLIDQDEEWVGKTIAGRKVLGALEDLPRIVHSHVVDEVVFVTPRSWLGKIEEALLFCETEGLRIHLAVDLFTLRFARMKQSEFNGVPLLTFETTPDKVAHLLVKRLMDIVISGAGLIVLSPLFLLVALLIKRTSPGPVFFRQVRCGLKGRTFILYKFRTMVLDAEERLSALMARNEMKGPVFKITDDPRLTPIGRFLRSKSLDELPQLWNVFRGDMSLVGPRPPLPREVKEYEPWQRRRLSMKPGLTCLWQISGRSKITDFANWVKLDSEYIDRWSLWLDVKILCRTVPAVVLGTGAH